MSFPLLKSQINSQSETFRVNQAQMHTVLAEFQALMKASLYQGPEKHVQRHQKSGKLLGRERVEHLLDRGSPFLELMPLAGHGQPDTATGGSVVAGIGLVSGKECLINASIPTIKGGSINHASLLKNQRLDLIAEENRLPMVYLLESAGADLPQQARVFNEGGSIFRNLTRRSQMGIPSVCVVFGSCTAGGAYIPGMADYVIMVQQQARMFLAGPPLVRMATGEITDEETLGGTDLHGRIAGTADYIARDEYQAIALAREVLAQLKRPPDTSTPIPVESPLYDAEDLLGIIPADPRTPYDIREVVARLVDGSRFSEFKPLYGPTLVTGWAHLHGHRVGILANNGVLFSESAQKGAQFIQLCNQSQTPLIFLQNITGFMVGQQYEEGGMIKHGAQLINAVSNSHVPAITVIVGASYGAGNYGMCGRAFQPRFLFSWPQSKIAVMGAEQLVGVMSMIQRAAAHKAQQPYDEEQAQQMQTQLKAQLEHEASAYYATSRIWDDGVIDPRHTRAVLGMCLAVAQRGTPTPNQPFGVFRL